MNNGKLITDIKKNILNNVSYELTDVIDFTMTKFSWDRNGLLFVIKLLIEII